MPARPLVSAPRLSPQVPTSMSSISISRHPASPNGLPITTSIPGCFEGGRMSITLPHLPELDPGDTGPFVIIAKHRAVSGTADALEKRMLLDLANTRAEHGCLQFHI